MGNNEFRQKRQKCTWLQLSSDRDYLLPCHASDGRVTFFASYLLPCPASDGRMTFFASGEGFHVRLNVPSDEVLRLDAEMKAAVESEDFDKAEELKRARNNAKQNAWKNAGGQFD